MRKGEKGEVLSKATAWATIISAVFSVISAIVAVISLVLMFSTSNEQTTDSVRRKILVFCLIISLCVFIIFTILFCTQFFKICKRLKKIITIAESQENQEKFCPLQNARYEYVTEKVSNMMETYLSTNLARIEKVRIICYGRNGYNSIVNRTINEGWNIKIEIIVCDPEFNPDICRWEHNRDKNNSNEEWKNSDEKDIKNNIKSWLKNSNDISVFCTKIPPMMRAAVIYQKPIKKKNENEINTLESKKEMRAIWGSIQSYRFALNESCKNHRIFLEKPKNSLICVCEETKMVKADFDLLINCFEEEFDRLIDKENSRRAELVDDELHFTSLKLRER